MIQVAAVEHRHRPAQHGLGQLADVLRSSDPKLSAEDIALGYKQLLQVERGWRDMKTTLDLRPVYHRREDRIRAHPLVGARLGIVEVDEPDRDVLTRRPESHRGHPLALSRPPAVWYLILILRTPAFQLVAARPPR
jgi:hypothetical protein